MIFQFSDGEFSDPIATSLKIWKKSIVLSLFALSVTLDKLNRNPQAFPPPRPPKFSFTHSSLAPPLENLLRGPWSWPFHWHASSLTLLINILPEGQSSWPELFILFHFMLLYWIAGIGIVFNVNTTIKYIHIFKAWIQLKILKFKYFKYGTKLASALSA